VRRRWLHGVVVGPDRGPLAGAYVVIVAASVPLPEITLVTDAQGGFAINLPEGTFRLRADVGGRSGEVGVAVPGDETVRITVS